MLLSFSVTNFRSIKETQTLNLIPSKNVRERPNMPSRSKKYDKLYTLNSAVIYGANNAGKSNFLRAFKAFKWIVEKSNRFQPGDSLEANEVFHFDLKTRKSPTIFNIEFIAPNDLRYQYYVKFNREKIIEEELSYYPIEGKTRVSQVKLYTREEGTAMRFGETFRGKKKQIEEILLPNQLFLSEAVNQAHEQLIPVYLFFSKHLDWFSFSGEGYNEIQMSTLGKFLSENINSPVGRLIENLIMQLDSSIVGIDVGKDGALPTVEFPDGFPEEEKRRIENDLLDRLKFRIKIKHRMFDGENEIGTDTLPLSEQSTGTNKFLSLLPPILSALQSGDVLLIDELDKSLHPRITESLIRFFHNEDSNPNNAQLIFVTHDPSLLSADVFSRDQIFLFQKNEYNATEVYPISEFSGVRSNSPFQKWYLSGRFGGIPSIQHDVIISRVKNSEIFQNHE